MHPYPRHKLIETVSNIIEVMITERFAEFVVNIGTFFQLAHQVVDMYRKINDIVGHQFNTKSTQLISLVLD